MKMLKLLFCSFWVAIPLLALYAMAVATATFVENDYGSVAARVLIYDAWWFNALHLYLLITLIGTLAISRAWQRKRYAIIVFHASLIVIIVGAGITRFFGFEGTMHIREGDSTSVITTSESFMNITAISSEGKIEKVSLPARISPFSNHSFNETTIIFGKPLELRSIEIYKRNLDKQDNVSYLVLDALYDNIHRTYNIIGGPSIKSRDVAVIFGETHILINWGKADIKLPFSLKLEKFDLQRYPGSMSPSSFASEVQILDGEGKLVKPYRIYMNRVLDYEGYRFFQSSYDPDEKGTILSVNKDPGKIPTYIGYTMLILGALGMLFAKEGRFRKLARFLQTQKIALWVFVVLLSISSDALLHANTPVNEIESNKDASTPQIPQDNPNNSNSLASQAEANDSSPTQIITRLQNLKNNSLYHTQKFAHLQLQDFGGRIKPIDTMAMDIIHKITKQDGFKGLNNNQVLLGMMLYPNDWKDIKMIYTSTPKLRQILGVEQDQKRIAFADAFSSTGYKLQNYVEEANRKKPSERGNFEKDILSVDERINLTYMVFSGQFLRIFPDKETNTWLTPIEALEMVESLENIPSSQAEEIQNMLSNFFVSFDEGVAHNQWEHANRVLDEIAKYQQRYGKDLYLPNTKVDSEIFLNRTNFFNQLTLPYILLGLILFITVLISVLRDKAINIWLARSIYALISICVLAHSLGLVLRWYVSGHSPWSNAYESMLYIAWAASIAGVVLFRKSRLALCASSFLAGIALFVAHLGFMDPQISNLVPVLKSYWLNIHVSIITASYGFLGLCFILGIIALIMFVIRGDKRPNIDQTILSLNAINEMSMIFGLFLLTAGNFLGGVWANESWGRYWGWDPKETWALISIGVYAIILHLRFMGFASMPYIFAAASVAGFYSVLMTYFGVNYYLSGLHSYAAGDPLPIPTFLYYFVVFTIILIVLAAFKRRLKAPNL